jgi:hypothetical protein
MTELADRPTTARPDAADDLAYTSLSALAPDGAADAHVAHVLPQDYADLIVEFARPLGVDTVHRCIAGAVAAVRLFGEDPEDYCREIALIARSDLDQVLRREDSKARVFGVSQPRRRPAD